MNRPMLKVRYVQKKDRAKRKTYLTDLEDLNYIVNICRAVVIQPDKFNLQMLEDAIRQAEGGKDE